MTQPQLASYPTRRSSDLEDVNGILQLLKPLEAEGRLIQRSRELLETDLERFSVLEHDGALIGCAALHVFSGGAELACLADRKSTRLNSSHSQISYAVLRS